MEEWTSIITNMGFPIAMCLLLFKKDSETQKQHKEEMALLEKAIENNTLVLTKVYEKIGEL